MFNKKISHLFRGGLMIVLSLITLASCQKEDEVIVLESYYKEIKSIVFRASDNDFTTDVVPDSIAKREYNTLLPFATDVRALVPTIEISEGATVEPASGEAQDFTEPITYTVTAPDGSVFKYKVSAETETGSGMFMVSFVIDGDEKIIDDEANTVVGRVAYGTNLNNIAPVITIHEGATVEPASGVAQDFTSPVTYIVSYPSGTKKEYVVSIENTPIRGLFRAGHEDYTLANYWPDGIENANWCQNNATTFDNDVAQAVDKIFAHEPNRNPLEETMSSNRFAGDDGTFVRTGQNWVVKTDEKYQLDGHSFMWLRAFTDMWGTAIPYSTFQVTKAVFENEMGQSFDITELTNGNELPIMLNNVYDETYKIKIWYVEHEKIYDGPNGSGNITSNTKVAKYREMNFSPFHNITSEVYDTGNETRECIMQEFALWSEVDGWVYGNGELDDTGFPSGDNVNYGYTEYLAENLGRGWLTIENNNITGKNLVYKINHTGSAF